MGQLICCVFFGLFALLPPSQDRAPVVDHQRLKSIHRREVKSKVEQLIISDSTRDRAWAAWFIGEYGLEEFAPDLFKLLNSDQLAPEWETSFLYRAVLDSLIRLDISAPSDSLTPLYKRFPAQTLIILARSPVKNREALLSIAEEPGETVYWVAACNLLTETKAPGFAAFLLKSLRIKVEITVSEKGNFLSGINGASSTVGCGIVQIPDGYPPTAFYELTDQPKRDAVVVAPGPHPVFYEREVIEPGIANQTGMSSHYNSVDRDRYSIEYLAALLNEIPTMMDFKERYSKSIAWSGIQRYKVEVISFREFVKGNFERLKRQCVEKELLSETEAEALKPNLIITARDLREKKTPPLPEIP